MLNQNANSNQTSAVLVQAGLGSQPTSSVLQSGNEPAMLLINGYCYVQFQVSTKKALAFVGGAGLMVFGKLNPELLNLMWELLF